MSEGGEGEREGVENPYHYYQYAFSLFSLLLCVMTFYFLFCHQRLLLLTQSFKGKILRNKEGEK